MTIDLTNIDHVVFLVGFATLFVTILGIGIAWKAYRHQLAMLEPWSVTKVDDNLWLLERTLPELATIYGYIGGYLCDSYEVTFLNPAVQPTGFFKKGTRILVKTGNLSAGSDFVIFYEEPKEEKNLSNFPYKGRIEPDEMDSLPAGVKTWTTCLY